MAWTEERLSALLAELRERGTDLPEVEVKSAAGGVPTLSETLCAFGNMPNGGTIILGLDERAGFTPVGLSGAAELEQAIASQARQLVPPVQVAFEQASVDDALVVIVMVSPVPAAYRPCRYGSKAYLRQGDGDYVMSPQEEQQILALRTRPRHDAAPIQGSSLDDLDKNLLAAYLAAARSSSRRLAGVDDEVLLRRKGVLVPEGPELTLAGLYALGAYPQQFLPSLSITAAVNLHPRLGERTRDLVHLDGPIPDLLEDAMAWVERNTHTTVRFGADGHGRDSSEIPMVAVRELVANALVHRDLGPHTQSRRVEIRLKDDELVISSPGGLYGVSQEQLGQPGGKSAVNEYLYEICKSTRSSRGDRVIEGEGGGIAEVQRTMKLANLRAPRFVDRGVNFTVFVPRHSLLGAADLDWVLETTLLPLTDIQVQIAASMRHGQVWTNPMVREEFAPIDSTEARALLQGLVTAGLAETRGERRGTEYVIRSEHGIVASPDAPQVRIRVRDMGEQEGLPLEADDVQAPPSPLPVPKASGRQGGPELAGNEQLVWNSMESGQASLDDLMADTGLTESQVRYALRKLRTRGLVALEGGQGRRDTVYLRRPVQFRL